MTPEPLRILVEWERTLNDLLDRTAKFPKAVRYSIGARMDEAGIDIALLLTDARYARGERRRRALEEVDRQLNRLRILVRLAFARRLLATGGYEHLSRELDTFGKGLGGWRRPVAAAES